MVVGRSQIRALRWMRQDSPLKLCDGLSGMQTCMWPRIVVVKNHFCHGLFFRLRARSDKYVSSPVTMVDKKSSPSAS
jgi:hypothetical protein